MTMVPSFYFICFLLSLSACGKFIDDDPKLAHDGTVAEQKLSEEVLDEKAVLAGPGIPSKVSTIKNRQLFFSTIDPFAAPWQAEVHRFDLETGELKRMLTGESSDPALFFANEKIWLFNRSYASQNFRSLSVESGKWSEQLAYAAGAMGDPHDAIAFGSGYLLTANYSQGILQILDSSKGKIVSDIVADWDLPAGSTFKPEALVAMQVDDKAYIYVIHQSLALQYNLLLSNGSQQVFVLEVKGNKIEVLDLDPLKPKVQGIKIKGSFPVPLRVSGSQTLRLLSLCSRLTSHVDGYEECQAAVEEIDPRTQQVQSLWDLNGSGLYMNGPAVAGATKDEFYANVDQMDFADHYEKRVLKFNIEQQAIQSVYQFNQDAGGFWGLFYDQDRQTLYIGDLGSSRQGLFTILTAADIAKQAPGKTLELNGVPYSGAFYRQ